MGRSAKPKQTDINPMQTTPVLSASTPEGRENELINMAYEEVARRIQSHEATSAELVHFLRMGSEKERLERVRIESEISLHKVKADAIEASKTMEEIAKEAINAFKHYSGSEEEE